VAARDNTVSHSWRLLRRFVLGIFVAVLLGLFLLSRIDSPRAEQFRMVLIDRFYPGFDWVLKPVTAVSRMLADFQSYASVYAQNQELRGELQRMKGWREAALQLEQKNAQLLALNNVKLSPKLSFITGEVSTDSGGPFSQSGLVNIGRKDGVRDGSAAVDGLGLVGRIVGVGERTSRLLFVSDVNFSVPVLIIPTGQKAIVRGDNTGVPPIDFLDSQAGVQAGSRVMTSGDGGVFPSGILIGQVVIDPRGRYRVRLAADFENLDFVRILQTKPREDIAGVGAIIGAPAPAEAPVAADAGAGQ